MAPNKVYTWREIMKNKTPFGKFLIFGSPYFSIIAFVYWFKIRPASLIPPPTNLAFGSFEGDTASSSNNASSSSSSSSKNSSSDAKAGVPADAVSNRTAVFGREVIPIYGPAYVPPPNPKQKKKKKSSAAEEEAAEPEMVVTGYRYL